MTYRGTGHESLILPKSRQCRWEGCEVSFSVGTARNQRYCAEHSVEAAKRRAGKYSRQRTEQRDRVREEQ